MTPREPLTRLGRPFMTQAQREVMARIGAELGAMKRRHAGERSALRARQRLEVRAMQRRVKAGRA